MQPRNTLADAERGPEMPKTRKAAEGEAKPKDRYRIDAVDRALQMLELLAERPGLRVTDLAELMNVQQGTGVPPAAYA